MRYPFILGVIGVVISGCGPTTSGKVVEPGSVKLERPAHDFERTLSACIDFDCQQLPTEKRMMSDYSPSLIQDIGLSQTDTLAEAREKIEAFKKTRIYSSAIGSTTDPKFGFLGAHMSPGPDTHLHEYDIVVRTKGRSNGAQVRDWGARIRCAPVTVSTPWQKTPC